MALGSMCDVNCGGTKKRDNKGKDGKRADYDKPRGKQKNPAKPKAKKPKAKKPKAKKPKAKKPKAKSKATKGAKSKTHSGKDYTGHKGDISKSKGKDVKKDNKNVDYSKKETKTKEWNGLGELPNFMKTDDIGLFKIAWEREGFKVVDKTKNADELGKANNIMYNKMKVGDLHKLATKRGLKGHSKDKKATLIKKLMG